eukprot:4306006-Pleurochrysis_carterae.AAC.1
MSWHTQQTGSGEAALTMREFRRHAASGRAMKRMDVAAARRLRPRAPRSVCVVGRRLVRRLGERLRDMS